jgi:hypothetical protein
LSGIDRPFCVGCSGYPSGVLPPPPFH